MKVSTSIRIGNIPALGTVELVPRGLWGLSENVLFLFGFMLSLPRFVLGGRRQCLPRRRYDDVKIWQIWLSTFGPEIGLVLIICGKSHYSAGSAPKLRIEF